MADIGSGRGLGGISYWLDADHFRKGVSVRATGPGAWPDGADGSLSRSWEVLGGTNFLPHFPFPLVSCMKGRYGCTGLSWVDGCLQELLNF